MKIHLLTRCHESRLFTYKKGIYYSDLVNSRVDDPELQEILTKIDDGLVLKQMDVTESDAKIFCDMSAQKIRSYLTPEFRRSAFNIVLNLSHPEAKNTATLVS